MLDAVRYALGLPRKFVPAEPEHKVLPLPMSRERWFDLAQRQNNVRAMNLQRQWTTWEVEETYRAIHG